MADRERVGGAQGAGGSDDPRRRLPAVGRILEASAVRRLEEVYGSEVVASSARDAISTLRESLSAADPEASFGAVSESSERSGGRSADLFERAVAGTAALVERRYGRRLTRILNATGIFLHTNLGRAPLPVQIAARLPGLLDAYCDLELERDSGQRGDRNRRAARRLESLTGAEAALVVNNNAAAMVLVLVTLASGREVVISRGEMVEIGGSFRVGEILEASGARLVEVGSTNRTRLADYRDAISDRTALLLKVYPSNYRIRGFTEEVSPAELVTLGAEVGVPVMVDEGSGLLRPHPSPQLRDHRSLSQLLADGCDLVCGSGDKLLGGPQAGLLLGRRERVEACRRHPLYRAFRPDRTCLAALEAVLELHQSGSPLPVDRLWADPAEHRVRLDRLAAELGGRVVSADAFLGGGSAPDAPIPGEALALPGNQRLLGRLREGDPPVIGYVREEGVLLDLRTVDPADDELLLSVVRKAVAEGAR